jgi:hypothetical protein
MKEPEFLPDHLNQNRRPDGKPWGTPFDHSNCWATASAEGVAFAKRGHPAPTPPEFRNRSGNLKRAAGYLSDIAAGARAFGVEPTTYVGLPWERFVEKLAKPNLAFVLATDYEKIPDGLSCLPTFDGNHSIIVYGGTLSEPDEKGVRTVVGSDPLCAERKRYPLFRLKDAATTIAEAQGQPRGTIFATQFRQRGPKPPPTPGETPDQTIQRLKAELKKADDALAAANQAVATANEAAQNAADERDDALARIEAVEEALQPAPG